jgi:hypothetical protein
MVNEILSCQFAWPRPRICCAGGQSKPLGSNLVACGRIRLNEYASIDRHLRQQPSIARPRLPHRQPALDLPGAGGDRMHHRHAEVALEDIDDVESFNLRQPRFSVRNLR